MIRRRCSSPLQMPSRTSLHSSVQRLRATLGVQPVEGAELSPPTSSFGSIYAPANTSCDRRRRRCHGNQLRRRRILRTNARIVTASNAKLSTAETADACFLLSLILASPLPPPPSIRLNVYLSIHPFVLSAALCCSGCGGSICCVVSSSGRERTTTSPPG